MALTDWPVARWLSGGVEQYHPLLHCMNHDYPWIITTVALDFAVAIGYVLIAYHWRQNERLLQPSPARTALANMRKIFTLCGICGYLFIPIELFWPAWRLYDGFMVALVFYTWAYALNAKRLKVVYTAIGRTEALSEDLNRVREESAQKSFFLNAISHDLRTPLNGLLLNADLAAMHTNEGDTASAVSFLEQIKASARHTSDLLDGLLEFARLGSDADRPIATDFELADAVHEAVAGHVNSAGSKFVTLTVTGDLGITLHTDRLKLCRVLNNLLSNAVRYTPAGSIKVDLGQDRTNVKISVIDTGIGIAAEHIDRLFDEFYQVHNNERDREKGLGLGLAISRRLVDQLGGQLLVESAPGRGSRFTVVLPASKPAARASTPRPVASFQTGVIAH